MVKKICLDSQILIWGIKNESIKNRDHMKEKATNLISSLAKNSSFTIIVPSVVIMELLMPCPLIDHINIIKEINSRFNPTPFDVAAAKAAAHVWQSKQSDSTINQLKIGGTIKSKIKVDCQIIGTAISRNMDCICSEDAGLKKLAVGLIEVKTMDELLASLNPLPLIDETQRNN